MGAGGKYWAFISYSHRDAAAASALQRALETYSIPKRLVGTRTAIGEVPAYLKPVFRDREEMQAGVDLKATVRAALADSRYLIVVCSPEAAASPWVNREIVEFKKLHGEAGVLAQIVAGEPFASRMPGREAEECFPEGLRFELDADGEPRGEPVEPVAADIRPNGDGKRLALLKLVAGMIDVGVDDLVRRDAQRAVRRMAKVAVAAVAGMATMAVLTFMAVQSRNDAQHQRAQAEDLIEFMLGDLRKKLVPVGRLDVLDSLGTKALAYYSAQDPDRLDAASLGRRSHAQRLIGEMREQRGQLDQALSAFQSAAETTAQLLERAPADGKSIFDHAQSVYWVGYVAWRRGQAPAAEESFLKYRELAQRLVRIDPANVDWQLETAYASQNLGVAQLDRGRTAEALQSFSETMDVLARLARARPELALDLADRHGWLARAREAAGDYSGAAAQQLQRLDILRSMPDSETDRQVQTQIANAYSALGSLQLIQQNLATAEEYARMATERADKLVSADPDNMFWLSESCFARLGLAEIEHARGKHALAQADLERIAPPIARLIASDTSAKNWQIALKGRLLALQARMASSDGRHVMTDNLEDYLATVERFQTLDKQPNTNESAIIAMVELALGDLLERRGRPDAAARHWRAVVARLRPNLPLQNFPATVSLARAELRLGQSAEARVLAAQVEASRYRHPAYADLVNEMAQGAGLAQSNVKPKGR